MSDCEKCWVTPCVCGYFYRNWSIKDLKDQIEMLKNVLNGKVASTVCKKSYNPKVMPVQEF